MRHAPLLAALLLSTAACSSYDFAKARRPDGSYDMPKLVADLAASGGKDLTEMTWIPLVYLDIRKFEASEANLPTGFTLTEATAFGPLFTGGSMTQQAVDPVGAPIETESIDWLGWGLLWFDIDQTVSTPFGTRLQDRGRFLLWGWDRPYYQRAPRSQAPVEAPPRLQ